jgi:cytochrome P450
MMMLALDVAGVDRPTGTDAEVDRLYELMDRLARASTVGHATGDKAAIVAEGDLALEQFEAEFFAASLTRRRALVDAVERGEADDETLPRDVLTTLLRNQDRLDLPYPTLLREVAYFPWVGSHSTSHQFVHAMHHVLDWLDSPPAGAPPVTAGQLVDDPALLQRFVHESLRLHPASPVSLRRALADVTLRSGVVAPAGSTVSISVHDANRDREVFGPDADEFRPFRSLPDGVAPWGLSFGHGLHACLGQELAGGLEAVPGAVEHHLLGSITVMARVALAAGARRDPDDAPVRDSTTTRQVFARYPVLFGPVRPG